MKQTIVVFIFLFCSITIKAQIIEFSGRITDPEQAPIPGVSVVIKVEDEFLGFGYTNESGHYSISIEKGNLLEVSLQVNSMGFKEQELTIRLTEESLFTNNLRLEEEIEALATVVISSDKKIEIKRDTIIYDVSRFADKTERTVEDVLKNIPGIEMDENGNIKAQGRNIKKILIEGDDLADSNYKVISQNLDAQVLDKVEVISNYDENPVLKQFLSSNAVVLNLKLKDATKAILFGSLEAGGGFVKRYFTDLNLGLIRPEIKFLNLGNLNNSGKTVGDQLSYYVFSKQSFNDFDENFERKNEPPVSLKGPSNMIDDKFYQENRSLANNLLANKTFSKNTKFRAALFYFNEDLEKDYTGINRYFIEPEDIVYVEENAIDLGKMNISSDLELSHSFSEDDFVNFRNSFKILNGTAQNKLVFNREELIDQYLRDKNVELESNLKYTRKIKGGAANFYLYLGNKNLDQDLSITPNTFETEPVSEGSLLRISNDITLKYQGLQTDLIFSKNKLSYSLSGGILNLTESLTSEVSAIENNSETSVDSLSGGNKASSFASNLKFKANYQFTQNTEVNTFVNAIHTLYKNDFASKNFLFVTTDLSFSTRTRIGNFSLGYAYDSEIPELEHLLGNYLVQSYRGLNKGASMVEPLAKHSYSLGYTFSRPEKRILFTTAFSYVNFENQLTTSNLLSTQLNISQYYYSTDQNFIFLNSGFTTYFDRLSSSFKIGFAHNIFERPSVVNEKKLMIKNENSNLYLRGTSYFRGFYNFKFSLNYSISKGEIDAKEVRNQLYNLRTENIFRFSDRLFGKFKNEFFLVESEFYESSTAEIEFSPEDSNWVFGLRAQNLFNNSDYTFRNISDFHSAETVLKSVPRYVLLYAKIRI